MSSRLTSSIALLLAAAGASGLPNVLKAGGAAAQDASPGVSADEKAVLAVDEAFVRAYNAGDAAAATALFAEDAEIIEESGLVYQGREALKKSLAETFERNKGARISLDVDSIRFLTPDSAKEQGRSTVKPVKGPAISRPYTVLFARRDGRWLIADVREEPDPAVPPHDRLRRLDWLLGEWLDEGAGADVRIDCRWSEDGNFLIQTFRVHRRGRSSLSVVQRIGWDPLAHQIRSWDFDSDGGYGEGRWTQNGDRWIVKHDGVRPDGTVASSTNFVTADRSDLVRWRSTDRVAAGRSEPDDAPRIFVRVPSPPAEEHAGDAGRPSSTPAAQESRQ